MDIAALSMVMSQARLQENVGIAVMKMAMDAGKGNAAQITETMKGDPNLGSNFDVSV
ncbi:MAG TPA: YjfB family protein [Ruminiclostridium sp.]